jgi:hypothetical protein
LRFRCLRAGLEGWNWTNPEVGGEREIEREREALGFCLGRCDRKHFRMMAKHHEKVTLSELVHPTWVGRSHFGRGIYHRAAEGKEGKEGKEGGKGGGHFLHSILPQTKSISLGVPFSAAAVHHHCDAEEVKKGSKKKEKKARSLESSPDRDELTKPVVVMEAPSLGTKPPSSAKEMRRQKSLPRIKSLERHATKPARVGLDFKKSASWSQV